MTEKQYRELFETIGIEARNSAMYYALGACLDECTSTAISMSASTSQLMAMMRRGIRATCGRR